jgi:hypothetical protein
MGQNAGYIGVRDEQAGDEFAGSAVFNDRQIIVHRCADTEASDDSKASRLGRLVHIGRFPQIIQQRKHSRWFCDVCISRASQTMRDASLEVADIGQLSLLDGGTSSRSCFRSREQERFLPRWEDKGCWRADEVSGCDKSCWRV